jgi:nicotinamidase/pyrazinamidase
VPAYDDRTALLVVDVQNDFADPEGSLYVQGGEGIVPAISGEVRRARTGGAAVIYTMDWHPEVTPHFQKDGGIWPVHCVHDTWGAELHPVLVVDGPLVRKGVDGGDGYSGFSVRDPQTGEVGSTTLDDLLKERHISRVVISGLATDYCVVETVLDARMLGYPVEVISSQIRAVERESGDGNRAIARMRDAGAEIF